MQEPKVLKIELIEDMGLLEVEASGLTHTELAMYVMTFLKSVQETNPSAYHLIEIYILDHADEDLLKAILESKK